MRIKRFEASDTKTALAMVKEEMGEDAVILATKTLPGSTKNNRKLPVEVLAAIDFDPENLPLTSHHSTEVKEQHKPHLGKGYKSSQGNIISTPFSPQPTQKEDDDYTVNFVTNVKNPANKAGGNKNIKSQNLSGRFASLLKKRGIPEVAQPQPLRTRKTQPPIEKIEKWRTQLIEQLQIKKIKIGRPSGPTILALVGATGVGKTTSAAKLAAWYSLHEGYKVTLLSMDCYRIGATDQLRTYAKIMRMPCEIALQKKDLKRAIARHQNQDLIIIDTAGKSPYDKTHIEELQEWFSVSDTIEPFLVLNATSKKEDINSVIKSYDPLSIGGIVLTKLDETRAYATLCQQLVASSQPIAYLCTGQKVPEDFLLASKDFLHTLFGQGWKAATAALGKISEEKAWS